MDNKYDAMALATLRELAKSKGLKGITALRKQELIEVLENLDKATTDSATQQNVDVDREESKSYNQDNKINSIERKDGNVIEPIEAKVKKAEVKKVEVKKVEYKNLDLNPVRVVEEKSSEYNQFDIKNHLETRNNTDTRSNIEIRNNTEIKNSEVKHYGIRNSEVQNNTSKNNDYKTSTSRNNEVRNHTMRTMDTQTNENKNADNYELKKDYRSTFTSNRDSSQARIENNLEQSTNTIKENQYLSQQEATSNRAENKADGKEMRKTNFIPTEMEQLDSGETKEGILEVLPDGYGFIRCDNFLPGENDVYVSPAQIRRFNLKTGDIVSGNTRIRSQNEKFSALLYVKTVNGFHPSDAQKRKKFEDLTPIFPNDRIHLEMPGASVSMRMVDLVSPIGKGQRGMIVSQPKTGKTTLLKQIAKAITKNHPDMSLIILLIDERPEEVTDIKESIEGKNVEVIYSTFDELPENHKRVSEMVIERAKRLVEHKKDVVILLDSITRLARAYNLTVQASGRTLSGGLDPAALHMPKKFFGAARNMREGGSLTILATALVDTGSRMDDVVFEEFKGTGNMELVLDRSLSEKRIFPAIDLPKSSTRRDDLLLSQSEMEANYLIRKALNGLKSDDALERIIEMFLKTKTNAELIEVIKKTKIVL